MRGSNRTTTNTTAARIVAATSGLAVAFWVLDAAMQSHASGTGIGLAMLPTGEAFAGRLVLAGVFAVAGAIAVLAIASPARHQPRRAAAGQTGDARYVAVLAAALDGILVVDRERRIVEASATAGELFAGDAEALPGLSLDELLTVEPLEGQSGTGLPPDTLFGAATTTANVSVRATNGRALPAEVRVVPAADADESCHVVAIRLTTDGMIAEKALRRSEMQYRALFDHIIDGVYRSRPSGELLAANPAMVSMLGYESREELLAKGNTNRLYKDPDQRTKIVAMLEERGVARNIELKLQRRDGSTLTVLANIRAIRDDSGIDIVYEGTLSDITDLLEARAALEDSEEHYRAVTENARDIINVIDEQGRILYASPSATTLTGRPADASVGRDFFAVCHADDVEEVRRQVDEVFIRPGRSRQFTCRVCAPADGSLRHFEVVGTAYMTRNGQLRAVFHSRDVTERIETDARPVRMRGLRAVSRLSGAASNN